MEEPDRPAAPSHPHVEHGISTRLTAPQIPDRWIQAEAAELAQLPGAGPFGPPDRPMGGYLALPAALPDVEAAAWVGKAKDYVATLPAKAKKSR